MASHLSYAAFSAEKNIQRPFQSQHCAKLQKFTHLSTERLLTSWVADLLVYKEKIEITTELPHNKLVFSVKLTLFLSTGC